MRLQKLYEKLLESYGPQGWWPLTGVTGMQPTKTGSLHGYHPNDYSYPKNESQRLEICIGAILSQNTTWVNVEKAITELILIVGELNVFKMLSFDVEELKKTIKPAGYYNQKTTYVLEFIRFYGGLDGRIPTREELLSVKGIGKETADSILLYGYSQPVFVVDAYAKRILSGHGLIDENASYDEVQKLFQDAIKKDYKVYQEFHALLVEHAKRYYSKKPYNDILI